MRGRGRGQRERREKRIIAENVFEMVRLCIKIVVSQIRVFLFDGLFSYCLLRSQSPLYHLIRSISHKYVGFSQQNKYQTEFNYTPSRSEQQQQQYQQQP